MCSETLCPQLRVDQDNGMLRQKRNDLAKPYAIPMWLQNDDRLRESVRSIKCIATGYEMRDVAKLGEYNHLSSEQALKSQVLHTV